MQVMNRLAVYILRHPVTSCLLDQSIIHNTLVSSFSWLFKDAASVEII
jgi:hypothetical protein